MNEDNKIYVGDKGHKSYVGSVLHNMSEDGSDNDVCKLISRGRSHNGLALDVAEILKRENDDISIEEIVLGTENFESDDSSGVATSLEITLVNK